MTGSIGRAHGGATWVLAGLACSTVTAAAEV